MQTLGFLVFFGDPIVGVVGGLCMLPITWLAWKADVGIFGRIAIPAARRMALRRG